MARLTPDELAKIAKQDDDDHYATGLYDEGDYDIDADYEKAIGNELGDEEELDLAGEVESDEDDIANGSDQQNDDDDDLLSLDELDEDIDNFEDEY